MTSKEKNNLSQIFKALSVDVRLDIILLLASGEKCVCEIFEKLELPQNLISHHLSILRRHHLIESHKDGKWVRYSLNKKNVEQLQDLAGKIIKIKEKPSKCKLLTN